MQAEAALRILVSDLSFVCYEYGAVMVASLLLATHPTHGWETGPVTPAPMLWAPASSQPATAGVTAPAPRPYVAVPVGTSVVSPLTPDDISSLTGGSVPPPATPVPAVVTPAPWTCSWTSSPAVPVPAGPSAGTGGGGGGGAPGPPRHGAAP